MNYPSGRPKMQMNASKRRKQIQMAKIAVAREESKAAVEKAQADIEKSRAEASRSQTGDRKTKSSSRMADIFRGPKWGYGKNIVGQAGFGELALDGRRSGSAFLRYTDFASSPTGTLERRPGLIQASEPDYVRTNLSPGWWGRCPNIARSAQRSKGWILCYPV